MIWIVLMNDKPKPQHPLRSYRSGVRCLMMAAITEKARKEIIMEESKKFDLSADIVDTTPAAQPITTAIMDVDGEQLVADLTSATVSYCSMAADTIDDKIRAYNAMTNASESLADHINEEIVLRHVFVEAINCLNEQTGEVNVCPRIVLISPDGTSYQAVSQGVYGSLKTIFKIFGTPDTWLFGIRCKVKRVKTRKGFFTNTLEIIGVVEDAKK